MSFSVNRQVIMFVCMICVLFFALRVRAEISITRQVNPVTCSTYMQKVNVDGYEFKLLPSAIDKNAVIQVGDLKFAPQQQHLYTKTSDGKGNAVRTITSSSIELRKTSVNSDRLEDRKKNKQGSVATEFSLYALTPEGSSKDRLYWIEQNVTGAQKKFGTPTYNGNYISVKKVSDYSAGNSNALGIAYNFNKMGEATSIDLTVSTQTKERITLSDGMPGGFKVAQAKHSISLEKILALNQTVSLKEQQDCKRKNPSMQKPKVAPQKPAI